jgi:glycogen operon protein
MNTSRKFNTAPGKPLPLGATITADGVNFSVFSRHATSIILVLFEKDNPEPLAEIVLDPSTNRTGDIWHIHLAGGDSSVRYSYRAEGPFDTKKKGHWFKKEQLLLDPYANAIEGGEIWGQTPSGNWRSCIVANDFDWEGDRPLNVPLRDSVIYELHVRGYTAHESSGVTRPGTYRGLIEKIPYIKTLGVTAVELLPVFEFNELENKRTDPKTGGRLKNFWGYSTMAFFAPKASYASKGWDGNQVREFKEMVKAFHRAGLEVILDVVFNHTAERDADGPTISFRGLDNSIYYALDPETKDYLDLAGCGNTVNCNHPVVHELIMDCLRYWVVEMHVDGFRFDLATILGRNDRGELIGGHSLLHSIEQDPVLADTKIIAEPWDIAGVQLGGFPGRWSEWNAYYRDDVRRFVRGDKGMVPALATRIAGSSDLFHGGGRRPHHSINFVTCHDGFTVFDLVSYEVKHNEANGEKERDGTNNNLSANCGVEGPTEDKEINVLRLRRIKTFFTILMVSHGVPMILAGDEFGRTQQGNNNAYCQDNDISWINWRFAEKHADLLRFFRKVIALRTRHPAFRRSGFLTGKNTNGGRFADITWHGLELNEPDWSGGARVLAFMLDGTELAPEDQVGTNERDDDFFVMMNGDQTKHAFYLPPTREGTTWIRIVDTGKASPEDILDEDKGEPLPHGKYHLQPSAIALFIAKTPVPYRS